MHVTPTRLYIPSPLWAPLFLVLTVGSAGTRTTEGTERLDAGEALERELEAGETHAYDVEPGAGQLLRLVAEQRGIDVEIHVQPADAEGFVADGPFDRRGRESVLLAGSPPYRVMIHGREVGAPPGRYVLRLEELPAAGPERDHRLEAARATTAAARLYLKGTPDAWRAALDHHQRALEHWRALGEDDEEALTLYAIAVLHRLVDVPHEALATAREAGEAFHRRSDALLEAYAWNEIGLDQWRLGEIDAARQAFERSDALGEREGDAFIVAAAASNLCLMDLSRGELMAGRACYERSLPAIGRARAPQIESAARTNLGRLAEHLGEPEEALAHYRRSLELATAAGARRVEARTLNNLGVLLRGLGELDAAMARYSEALEIFEGLDDRRGQARTLSNIGYAYRSLDDPRRAQVHLERARMLFRQAEDHRGEAATLDNLGLLLRDLGRSAEALELHRQALELRRRDGHRRGEAVTLRRLGEIHAELGDHDAALGRLRESVDLAVELGDRSSEAAGRQELGEIHLERGELEAARRELETARELAAAVAQPTIEARILYHLARLEATANRREEARRRVADAIERLEDVRTRIDSPDLRTAYSSLPRLAYELAAELLMRDHRSDPTAAYAHRALEVAERARARALVELLQEADVDLTRGVDPELLAEHGSLARRLDAKTERLADARLDSASRKLLAAEQLTLLQRLAVLEAEIRRHSPAYGEIVRPRALTAAEIQSFADPGTTLGVYLSGEPRSYLFRVTSEAVDAFELPGRAAIEAAARRVHALWSELDAAARATDHAAAEELAEILRVSVLVGGRRLAVIADGALHLVPFAALPVAGEPGTPPVPLVTRTQVVALPSASVLALTRNRDGAPTPRSMAILADPVFGPEYPPLPGSRLEAEAIAAALSPAPALAALGVDANRELVESGRLRRYAVVHFATHGVIDTENPALSGLVLSQVDAEGRPRRGFLRLHDIYNLRFDAELVVLSGCRTALGPMVRGEGLIGLARGFMYAGARRVVASLWTVDDRATAALMTRFYRAMWEEDLAPAAALAAAQRELSQTRRFRDPYHWAGFVLIGDWR